MARIREFDTDQVLDKAILLFWNKGYNGVSTQDLTAAFEISKSSMYGAFGDKMELFIAALEKYRHQVSSDIVKRLENCSSVKNEIKAILTSLTRKALEDKDKKGCFLVNSCVELAPHDQRIAKICLDHRKTMEKAFSDAIHRGISTGELSASLNPKNLSIVICNAISGLKVDAKYLGGKKHFDNVITSIVSLLG